MEDSGRKVLSVEERWGLLIPFVLETAVGKAREKLPPRGIFQRIKVGLIFPEDPNIHGLLNVEPGSDKNQRVVHVGAYRSGSDRLVSNYFFFDSTQAVLDWLAAAETVALLIETYRHLGKTLE